MWEKTTERDHIRAFGWLPSRTLGRVLNDFAKIVNGRITPAVPAQYGLDASAAEGNRLRAARRVVAHGKRAIQAARSTGIESDIDSATRSGYEVHTAAGVGFAKIGGHGGARNAKGCCAVIVQRDGLRGAGCANELVSESQASC